MTKVKKEKEEKKTLKVASSCFINPPIVAKSH